MSAGYNLHDSMDDQLEQKKSNLLLFFKGYLQFCCFMH